jgi:hypothetical protein
VYFAAISTDELEIKVLQARTGKQSQENGDFIAIPFPLAVIISFYKLHLSILETLILNPAHLR